MAGRLLDAEHPLICRPRSANPPVGPCERARARLARREGGGRAGLGQGETRQLPQLLSGGVPRGWAMGRSEEETPQKATFSRTSSRSERRAAVGAAVLAPADRAPLAPLRRCITPEDVTWTCQDACACSGSGAGAPCRWASRAAPCSHSPSERRGSRLWTRLERLGHAKAVLSSSERA